MSVAKNIKKVANLVDITKKYRYIYVVYSEFMYDSKITELKNSLVQAHIGKYKTCVMFQNCSNCNK